MQHGLPIERQAQRGVGVMAQQLCDHFRVLQLHRERGGDWPAAVRKYGLAPWRWRSFVAAGWFIETARVSGVLPIALMHAFTSIFVVERRRMVSSSSSFAEAVWWRRVLPSWGLGTFG